VANDSGYKKKEIKKGAANNIPRSYKEINVKYVGKYRRRAYGTTPVFRRMVLYAGE